MLWLDQFVLGFANRAQHRARFEFLVVKIHLFEDLLHERILIIVVINDKTACQADALAVTPEKARARRVKGADRQIVRRRFADELHQAFAHFACRFVCKRYGKHVVRRDVAVINQIRDAMG